MALTFCVTRRQGALRLTSRVGGAALTLLLGCNKLNTVARKVRIVIRSPQTLGKVFCLLK